MILHSCWEQLRTGKAWQRLSLVLLVAVMTLTAQTVRAQGNPTTYDELVTAINDITAGGTVTLGGDIAFTGAITIDKDVTIDLNDHSITISDGTFFYIYDNKHLTIRATGGGNVTKTDMGNAFWVFDNGILTIEGGNISTSNGAAIHNNGTTYIYGGTINGNSSAISNSGTMYIFGGTIGGSSYSVRNEGSLYVFTGATLQKGIYEYSGTVVNPVVASVTTSDASMTSYYGSMAYAVTGASASSGSTVKLWDNVDLGTLGSSNGIEIQTGANFTLDLNGHALKGSTTNAVILVNDFTTLVITDGVGGGSIVNEYTDNGYAVMNNGTVTISGGTFSGRSGLCNSSGGTMTVSGGTISCSVSDNGAAIENNATLTVSGGTLIGSGGNSAGILNGGTANVGACTIKGCGKGILNLSTLNLTALPTFGSGTDANGSDIMLYDTSKKITFGVDIAAAPTAPIVVSYYTEPTALPLTFTSGYATHCTGIAPADMFTYGGTTSNVIAFLDGEAQWVKGGGNCGQTGDDGCDVTWNYNPTTKALTISGTGAMMYYGLTNDYLHSTAPWANFDADMEHVIINDGVTSVGAYAFAMCSKLTTVSLPASVFQIDQAAFYTSNVTRVDIPSTAIVTLGANAFDYTPAALVIAVPANLLKTYKEATNWSEYEAKLEGVLSETTGFATTFATGNYEYSRTFNCGVAATLCLPFELNSMQISPFGKVYRFDGIDKTTESKWTVVMTEEDPSNLVTGNLSANTPYLFVPYILAGKSKGDAMPLIFTGEVTTAENAGYTNWNEGAAGYWTFQGVYYNVAWNDGNANIGKVYGFAAQSYDGSDYTVNPGDFVKAMAGASIAPFRAFLQFTPAAGSRTRGTDELPASMSVRLVSASGSTPTAIGTLDTRTGEITFGDEWYSLDGRRLGSKPATKGVYINNGKKAVIK